MAQNSGQLCLSWMVQDTENMGRNKIFLWINLYLVKVVVCRW